MFDQKRKFYDEAWESWQGMIDNSPAPKHRRRIIRDLISKQPKDINSVLDVGCGNAALLSEVSNELGNKEIKYTGFDISGLVIEENKNNQFLEGIKWQQFDLDEEEFVEKYDVVLCSEVLEHLQNWKAALSRILYATEKYLIVTIPSGHLYKIDSMVGHKEHFTRKTIETYFEGIPEFSVEIFFWGFPFHRIYKELINLRPNAIYGKYAGGNYSWKEKFVSQFINLLFYFNLKTKFETSQMFFVAQRH